MQQSQAFKQLRARYADALEPWQLEVALSRLLRFKLPPSMWDDAMQDMVLTILEFQIDLAKSPGIPRDVILRTRLDQTICNMARTHRREQNKLDRYSDLRHEEVDSTPIENGLIREDLHEALATVMTDRQMEICQAFMAGDSVSEIAARSGRHRSTVYEQVRSIRRKLEGLGIELES